MQVVVRRERSGVVSSFLNAAASTVEVTVVGGIKHWLKSIRHLPDRIRHAARRRAAIERLTNAAPWRGTVLFVCHGNVCRSPFAEVLFAQQMRAAGIATPTGAVASAGFVGPGRPSPAEAIAAAARVGLDLTASRSKLLTAELVDQASLIVVMAAEQATRIQSTHAVDPAKLLVLGDLDPLPIATRSIRDPWKGSAEVFDKSYARIDRCIRVMIDCLPAPLDRAGVVDLSSGVR